MPAPYSPASSSARTTTTAPAHPISSGDAGTATRITTRPLSPHPQPRGTQCRHRQLTQMALMHAISRTLRPSLLRAHLHAHIISGGSIGEHIQPLLLYPISHSPWRPSRYRYRSPHNHSSRRNACTTGRLWTSREWTQQRKSQSYFSHQSVARPNAQLFLSHQSRPTVGLRYQHARRPVRLGLLAHAHHLPTSPKRCPSSLS